MGTIVPKVSWYRKSLWYYIFWPWVIKWTTTLRMLQLLSCLLKEATQVRSAKVWLKKCGNIIGNITRSFWIWTRDLKRASIEYNPVCGFEVSDFRKFRWLRNSSVLGDEPGFGRIQSSVFPDLGLGLAHFWSNRFKFGLFGGV